MNAFQHHPGKSSQVEVEQDQCECCTPSLKKDRKQEIKITITLPNDDMFPLKFTNSFE